MPSANTVDNYRIPLQLEEEPLDAKYEDIVKKKIRPNLYHWTNNTSGDFPTLRFYKEYIPAGQSPPMCMHLSWVRANASSAEQQEELASV